MVVSRETGGNKRFVDTGIVEPLEPERARAIKLGYTQAYFRKILQKFWYIFVGIAIVILVYTNAPTGN